MVTGGYRESGSLTSVEVLSADGTPLPCTIPPLPTRRNWHTQDGLISCGGYVGYYIRTCVKLSTLAGGWVETHNMLGNRSSHSSWQSPAGLVLIGGYQYPNGRTTTEMLSSSDSSTSYNFSLEYITL